MRVWITSYALTKGILEMDGEVSERYPEHLRVVGHITSFIKPDWHETEEAAIARADDMRVKRVESLRKQIAKLEKLKFGNAMPTRRQ